MRIPPDSCVGLETKVAAPSRYSTGLHTYILNMNYPFANTDVFLVQVTFSKAFESLAAATIENVVQEKFSSKALRIFRWGKTAHDSMSGAYRYTMICSYALLLLLRRIVRNRVYAEESQIQTLAMINTKETKLLTYQVGYICASRNVHYSLFIHTYMYIFAAAPGKQLHPPPRAEKVRGSHHAL